MHPADLDGCLEPETIRKPHMYSRLEGLMADQMKGLRHTATALRGSGRALQAGSILLTWFSVTFLYFINVCKDLHQINCKSTKKNSFEWQVYV